MKKRRGIVRRQRLQASLQQPKATQRQWQLQPQPQPQDGQTRGVEASSEVDREADKRWSLVGDGVKDSEIWEIDSEIDSVNTDDSSSEASPDQQDFGILD